MCRGRNRRIFQSKRRRNQKQRKVSVKVGRPPPKLGNIENTKPVIRYGTLNQETSVGPGNVGERRRKNCKEIQTGLQLREKNNEKIKPTHSSLILSRFPPLHLLQIQQFLRLRSSWSPFPCELFNAGIVSLEVHFCDECFERRKREWVGGGEGVDEEEGALDCARARD